LINNIKSSNLFLILVFVQIVHSIEEIIFHLNHWFPLVTSKIRAFTGFFPVLEISDSKFFIGNVIIIIFLISLTPLLSKKIKFIIRLSVVIAVIEIINGFGHISGAIVNLSYYPGCISGIGLILMGIVYLKKVSAEKQKTV